MNRPFSLVYFVFPIQIMWWYSGDLILCLANIVILACTLFNEQDKGSNLLSIITWSVLGKQNVQGLLRSTKKAKSVPIQEDCQVTFYNRLYIFFAGYSSVWRCGAVCTAEEVFLQGEKVSVCWRFWFREWIWRQSGNLKSFFDISLLPRLRTIGNLVQSI